MRTAEQFVGPTFDANETLRGTRGAGTVKALGENDLSMSFVRYLLSKKWEIVLTVAKSTDCYQIGSFVHFDLV